jgi:hypothetical protein
MFYHNIQFILFHILLLLFLSYLLLTKKRIVKKKSRLVFKDTSFNIKFFFSVINQMGYSLI